MRLSQKPLISVTPLHASAVINRPLDDLFEQDETKIWIYEQFKDVPFCFNLFTCVVETRAGFFLKKNVFYLLTSISYLPQTVINAIGDSARFMFTPRACST